MAVLVATLFIAVVMGLSIATLRYSFAGLATRMFNSHYALRFHTADLFGLMTLVSLVVSITLLVDSPEVTRIQALIAASILATMTWIFSVIMLSASGVNHPTKRLVFTAITCPATLLAIANCWVVAYLILVLILSLNFKADDWGRVATLLVLQIGVLAIRRLNEWIALSDATTHRPTPLEFVRLSKPAR